ncbi:uncharacterized protein LOC121095515 [Falco naumanni]|uniref:uncharacterized protein LOC121095515 n=1 Tax=Falco naumanni TaxID=148594 RepID=UPI001ADE6E25|nr:uncharacterized protein LOC121095515 [Falco naumanni]XP_040466373.1 uncharacterized protein LOC121095515 [Falco naumanni]XP_040466374.1 uncharacterized protein LOC121095515 [Falco naumanni]XP_040466375.1 uncharacterized protein LOC121095515 [Falco naumanni]XP_040466376.1 uncharacterized protein LOC121095515 [Falco naumanni]XP_040466378.1 uncharacterized protein LOC121095515 [Falco naumanni]XP_040466379.1 uncharacterized protein LOC121095515 [Falco naumanni]XP_040466380.1 uncharacterized p
MTKHSLAACNKTYKTPAELLSELEPVPLVDTNNPVPVELSALPSPPSDEGKIQYPSLSNEEPDDWDNLVNRGGERKNEQSWKVERQSEKPFGDSSCRKMPESWDLCPACITVRSYNPISFWQKVKAQALQEGNWDFSETINTPMSEPAAHPSIAMVFPVVRGGDTAQGIMNEHKMYSWKVIQDLQKCVAQCGPNSPATMQLIRLLTMEVVTPYHIAMLAQIMFQPMQCTAFKTIRAQKADAQALRNLQFPQDDVRFGNGSDVLTEMRQFSNPQHQAQWHLLVLEQVKAVGIEALIWMAELAEPKAKYTMIRQGAREPFLQFVGKL